MLNYDGNPWLFIIFFAIVCPVCMSIGWVIDQILPPGRLRTRATRERDHQRAIEFRASLDD